MLGRGRGSVPRTLYFSVICLYGTEQLFSWLLDRCAWLHSARVLSYTGGWWAELCSSSSAAPRRKPRTLSQGAYYMCLPNIQLLTWFPHSGCQARNTNTFLSLVCTPLLVCGTPAPAGARPPRTHRSPGPPTCVPTSGWADSQATEPARQPASSAQDQPGCYRFRLLSVLLLVGVGSLSTPQQPLGHSTVPWSVMC